MSIKKQKANETFDAPNIKIPNQLSHSLFVGTYFKNPIFQNIFYKNSFFKHITQTPSKVESSRKKSGKSRN